MDIPRPPASERPTLRHHGTVGRQLLLESGAHSRCPALRRPARTGARPTVTRPAARGRLSCFSVDLRMKWRPRRPLCWCSADSKSEIFIYMSPEEVYSKQARIPLVAELASRK